MDRRLRLALFFFVLTACNGFVGEVKVAKPDPLVAAPADAREIGPGTFIKTIELKDPGEPIAQLSVFGFAETINPGDAQRAVTSLEEGQRGSLPAGLQPVFAGARLGETRRVWNCPPGTRVR